MYFLLCALNIISVHLINPSDAAENMHYLVQKKIGDGRDENIGCGCGDKCNLPAQIIFQDSNRDACPELKSRDKCPEEDDDDRIDCHLSLLPLCFVYNYFFFLK